MNRIEFTSALTRSVTALFIGAVLTACGGGGGGGVAPATQFSSVADGANPNGCVRDSVTGLMWEVKTADGGLRDWTKTYTNYDSTLSEQIFLSNPPLSTAKPSQAMIDAATNSIGFKNRVNALGLCSFSDWRLPTHGELQSLVKVGSSPTIDTAWFPNTQPSVYWSASPDVVVANNALVVSFFNGRSGFVNLRNCDFFSGTVFCSHVRLVRASQ